MKSKSTCHKCGNIRHWASDHASGGSYHNTKYEVEAQKKNADQKPKNVLSFNMSHFGNIVNATSNCSNVPLLDDAAPYSGMGTDEFELLAPILLPNWNGEYEPLPESVSNRPYWQYGSGNHASESRRIIGSVMLFARTDLGNCVDIRHLIIEGSSQWLIGKNVTKHCNIEHIS